MFRLIAWSLGLLCVAATAAAEERPADVAPNATLEPAQLAGFEAQPAKVQELVKFALSLAAKNLTYTYSSADPVNGGMDCSGFIYHVLRHEGFDDVPRQASEQYAWARKAGTFRAVLSRKPDGFELKALQPGDLLFWSGTYVVDRDPPVTHTMIYLGLEKRDKRAVMIGASNGRSYRGKKRWGVSVFDFKSGASNPKSGETGARFVGYARIPGLER